MAMYNVVLLFFCVFSVTFQQTCYVEEGKGATSCGQGDTCGLEHAQACSDIIVVGASITLSGVFSVTQDVRLSSENGDTLCTLVVPAGGNFFDIVQNSVIFTLADISLDVQSSGNCIHSTSSPRSAVTIVLDTVTILNSAGVLFGPDTQSTVYGLDNLTFSHVNMTATTSGFVNIDVDPSVSDITFIIEDSTFSRNIAPFAVTSHSAVDVAVKRSTFTNNTNDGANGGALKFEVVEVSRTMDVVVEDSVFVENMALKGAGLFLYDVSGTVTFTLKRTDFYRNYATFYGGGYYIYNPFKTIKSTVENCKFIGNYAGADGGGLFAYSTLEANEVTLNNLDIRENMARRGAGFFFYSSSGSISLMASDLVVTENYADHSGGGGVLMSASRSIHSEISKFSADGNTAEAYGGVLYGEAGLTVNMTISDSHFDSSVAGTGSSLSFSSRSTFLSLQNSNVTNGNAQNMGSVYVDSFEVERMELQNVQFSHNSALYGGDMAISLTNFVNLYVLRCSFTSSSAAFHGGSIYIESSGHYLIDESTVLVDVQESNFTHMTSGREGSVIYVQVDTIDVQSQKNLFSHNDGKSGVYIEGRIDVLRALDDTWRLNKGAVSGFRIVAPSDVQQDSSTFDFSRVVYDMHESTEAVIHIDSRFTSVVLAELTFSSCIGGRSLDMLQVSDVVQLTQIDVVDSAGLRISGEDVDLESTTFRNSGKCLEFHETISCVMSSMEFEQCSLEFSSIESVTITDSSFHSNAKFVVNDPSTHMFVGDSSTTVDIYNNPQRFALEAFASFTGENVMIHDNKAGGMLIQLSGEETFNLITSSIHDNKASDIGGGVVLRGDDTNAQVHIASTVDIVRNNATYGGGVFISISGSGSGIGLNAHISYNRAWIAGGGVYYDTGKVYSYDHLAPYVTNNFAPNGKEHLGTPVDMQIDYSVSHPTCHYHPDYITRYACEIHFKLFDFDSLLITEPVYGGVLLTLNNSFSNVYSNVRKRWPADESKKVEGNTAEISYWILNFDLHFDYLKKINKHAHFPLRLLLSRSYTDDLEIEIRKFKIIHCEYPHSDFISCGEAPSETWRVYVGAFGGFGVLVIFLFLFVGVVALIIVVNRQRKADQKKQIRRRDGLTMLEKMMRSTLIDTEKEAALPQNYEDTVERLLKTMDYAKQLEKEVQQLKKDKKNVAVVKTIFESSKDPKEIHIDVSSDEEDND